MKFSYYGISDVGRRYEHNEDYFLLPIGKEMLFIVCDGVGGANSGEVASKTTAQFLAEELSKSGEKQIKESIYKANQKLIAMASGNEKLSGMATTLVLAYFSNDKAQIYSVGDSRCYLYRGNQLEQLTEDQSEVWKLFKMGAITKEQLRTHPRNNVITMAMGTDNDLEVNSYTHQVKEGDVFLLCSDGLTDMLPEGVIAEELNKSVNLEETAKELVRLANEAGGKDNITLILVKVEKPKKRRGLFGVISLLLIVTAAVVFFLQGVKTAAQDISHQETESEQVSDKLIEDNQELVDELSE